MKVTYIHPRKYPSQETNALQAIKMASAFSELADTTFIIPSLSMMNGELKNKYSIPKSPLKIRSMLFNYVPDRFLLRLPSYFGRAVSFYLRHHPRWRYFKGQKILFVRDPKALLFWGKIRKSFSEFNKWIFIFEGHSTIGLDPVRFHNIDEIDENNRESQYRKEILDALMSFDLVICLTKALANDLMYLSNNRIKPTVIRHASNLPRIPSFRKISFGTKIVIGYFGQISQFKGVQNILEALTLLPARFNLRLVGKFHQEDGVDPYWLKTYLENPLLISRVEVSDSIPIDEVANEIDKCDVLIQPASSNVLNSKYEAPIKSSDYMARGKPIIAADVPCHHELFKEGENGLFFSDSQDLANKLTHLVNNPNLANEIALGAWNHSALSTFNFRAKEILNLVDSLNRRKKDF
ncbi:glycosyltransferase family 4 protein [Chloroflexota bacterium]